MLFVYAFCLPQSPRNHAPMFRTRCHNEAGYDDLWVSFDHCHEAHNPISGFLIKTDVNREPTWFPDPRREVEPGQFCNHTVITHVACVFAWLENGYEFNCGLNPSPPRMHTCVLLHSLQTGVHWTPCNFCFVQVCFQVFSGFVF